MSDSITFKYTLTEEDYVRAMRAYLYYERGWRTLFVFVGLCVCLMVVLAVVVTVNLGRPYYKPVFYAGAFVLGAVAVWWLVGLFQRKAAKKSPFVGTEYDMSFSPGGVTSRSPLTSGEARWSVYTGARESPEFILLCSGIGLYYPFPKKIFDNPEDLERFRELIRTHVPNARLLNRAVV